MGGEKKTSLVNGRVQLVLKAKTAEYRATGRPRSSRDVHFVANRAGHLLKISVLAKPRAKKPKNIAKIDEHTKTAIGRATGHPKALDGTVLWQIRFSTI